MTHQFWLPAWANYVPALVTSFKLRTHYADHCGACRSALHPQHNAGDDVGVFDCSVGPLSCVGCGQQQQRSRTGQMQELLVRSTCDWVTQQAQRVAIKDQAINSAADRIVGSIGDIRRHAAGFDTDMHYCDGGPLTAQYLLVVDALNFCFWPDDQLEYEHLAGGIKASLLRDPHCLDAEKLAAITGSGVRDLLGWKRDLPEQEERARLLREVGAGLLQHFKGQAAELIAAAGGSAVALVNLVTAHFPGFRDHAVYGGRQVFFYKRAQIFVGDVYGAFGGVELGSFRDIDQLTMFADYRVPVVLREMGVLQYSQELAQQVDKQQEISAGSEAETEIRAASVMAVELLKDAANARLPQQHQPGDQSEAEQPRLLSIQLDWWLWHEGERMRTEHPPHHRTRTIFY